MSPENIITIVLLSLNFITGLITPIILIIKDFTRRIEKSDCCGSSLILRPSSSNKIETTIIK